MKIISTMRLWGLGFALASLLVGGLAAVIGNHPRTRDSVKSSFVSSSGEKLAAFFDGRQKVHNTL